ncbi:MAG TPA: LytTR family DNA-binding domain-containing protein [Acholeplasma sp.]
MIKLIIDQEDLKLIEALNLPVFPLDKGVLSSDGSMIIEIDESELHSIQLVLEVIKREHSLLMFETKDGWVQIKPKHIWYIESFGEEIYLYTDTHGKLLVRHTMYELEAMLKPYHIVRIGKSYMVNVAKIESIKVKLNAKLGLTLTNGKQLEVMRTYVKPFKSFLGIRR